jgi:PhnB protein
MSTRLNPYLNFPGTTRQAMEFYHDVLGGDLMIDTFGEYGSDDPATKDSIMHATLETPGGLTLMASDLAPGMVHKPGENISISLSGDDAGELRGYWEKLSAGGTVTMPLEKQVWGDEFGMCTDRYGIGWMVNISQRQ